MTTNQTVGSQLEILDKGVPLTRGEVKNLTASKRNLILIRRMLRPFDAIVPRSEIQYWVMIL